MTDKHDSDERDRNVESSVYSRTFSCIIKFSKIYEIYNSINFIEQLIPFNEYHF